MASKTAFFPDYKYSIVGTASRQRHEDKLTLINEKDPPLQTLMDGIGLWPTTTYINVDVYIVFSSSPYTRQDFQNYKSIRDSLLDG